MVKLEIVEGAGNLSNNLGVKTSQFPVKSPLRWLGFVSGLDKLLG